MKSSAKCRRAIWRKKLEGAGAPLAEALAASGLCPSKGPGAQGHRRRRRVCQQYPRGQPQRHLTAADLLFGKHLLLRKGKRNYTVMSVK
jgi:tyrosyl-tRNA synthetase